MSYSNNIPMFNMSPPQFSSSTDIIEVTPPFPISNQRRFEPHSALDPSHSFKRPRMSHNNHSNTVMGPPPRINHPPPNRPTGNIFFKTRICTRFGFGTCRNGENCTFAHGADEIRQPPPNWQELIGPRAEERLQLGGNRNDDQKIIHKMKLCKRYYNGEECPYGDKCNFLHEDPAKFRDDSWNTRESSAISIGTSNHLEGNMGMAGTKPARGTNWKTKACLKWINTGTCPFGDKCHFAHVDAVKYGQCSCDCDVGGDIKNLNVFTTKFLVPGGGIEAEAAVAITNSTKVVIPTLPTTGSSANYALTTLPANVPAMTEEEKKEEEKKAKKELLWKKINKSSHIYGDWIDD